MKKCFKCGIEKEIDEFYKHFRMADGHLGKCKECAKNDVVTRYYKNISKIRQYEKIRNQDDRVKQQIIEYQRKRRAKYPEKYKARNIIQNSIRDNKIVRQPCEVCGDCKAEAHHEDYKNPLDVKWLCFKHHRKRHGQLNYIFDNLGA